MSRILRSLVLLSLATGCASTPDAGGQAADADTLLATPALADTNAPVPLLDLDVAEMLRLTEVWTGDFDGTSDRRFIRVLVPFSRTLYYLDRGVQKGIAFESLREFESRLPAGATGVRLKVVIIPTRRDRLISALAAGYGDIAIGGFTIIAAGTELVDASEPTMTGVKDVVVTRRGIAPMTSENDLAGREIHVRQPGAYHDDLVALNARLSARGLAPVVIREVDGALEDEDVLQMVDAGIIPATVTKLPIATFWEQLYDSLAVHDSVPLRADGEMAWAIRKNTPELKRMVNGFVRQHRAGTAFGNTMLRRYLGSVARLTNPNSVAHRQRFETVRGHIERYATQYDLPWLLVAAQAYQESQFDQSRRSSAGAVGVMQIKPETAADRNVGISGIDQVESNIHAGIKYLNFVRNRYFADSTVDRLNRGLLALAAYNAGPGRVRQLRAKAKAAGLDPDVWFGNVEIIAAREIGRETVDYVSNIYKYYTVYLSVAAVRDSTGSGQ